MTAQLVTADFLRADPLPVVNEDGDKDHRGRVLVVAGSVSVPGAALLAATAALRAGAGKLQIATCRTVAMSLGLAVPEALVVGLPEFASGDIASNSAAVLFERVQQANAVLIGPGMLDADEASALTERLLDCPPGPAFVLDAGALGDLTADIARHNGNVVLTPHAGEMATMIGIDKREVGEQPQRVAAETASRLKCIIVLKGYCTHIAAPDGTLSSYEEGAIGLATSGSGDTLAGIIVGLLARGASPMQAAEWGVYLHGEAGNRLARTRGPLGFLARELLWEIPAIMAGLSH